MKRARGLVRWLTVAMVLVLAAALLWMVVRGRPQDLPWTPLDLGEQPGMFTGRKLAALGDDPAACRALLTRAGVRFEPLTARRDGPSCGYTAAVRLRTDGARRIALDPREPVQACPVAAALAMWEWTVVQPAARKYLGTAVTRVEHLGTYNCRRIAGRESWSEHATGNAIDIAGFRFADGRRLTILADWRGDGPEATFLRQVRTGACDLYATVLSPDYNAAHRDHLHLDQADRGAMGWRACR
ncbi:MAG: extensin [Sphingomonas bacterium]|uniref:extensin-like domain-containing protein n=1 Tax=Sphingomonas bacterium TaxID=1895847 RepID=UPI002601F094|nr:extensin family protein [Sphingomonas bacterium]MDB5696652.1 extensin [Sphingomonas bacterium]